LKFKIAKTDKFEKIFNESYKVLNKKPKEVKFKFDGEELGADQTPEDLDMEDGDQVEMIFKK